MRGKVALLTQRAQPVGITPACAGKRVVTVTFPGSPSDHPRVCGEKRRPTAPRTRRLGSPPRVRGKDVLYVSTGKHKRITPACAGKSTPKRLCPQPAIGSPPRVRGKGHPSGQHTGLYRITPACAGKSVPSLARMYFDKDHPRVCGEKYWKAKTTVSEPGSPPRVRGKGWISTPVTACSRITPACAGKSPKRLRVDRKREDHPRVCGEKIVVVFNNGRYIGSPPRVRGKASGSTQSSVRGRITPACAGKSACFCFRWCWCKDHPRVCGEKTKESLKK